MFARWTNTLFIFISTPFLSGQRVNATPGDNGRHGIPEIHTCCHKFQEWWKYSESNIKPTMLWTGYCIPKLTTQPVWLSNVHCTTKEYGKYGWSIKSWASHFYSIQWKLEQVLTFENNVEFVVAIGDTFFNRVFAYLSLPRANPYVGKSLQLKCFRWSIHSIHHMQYEHERRTDKLLNTYTARSSRISVNSDAFVFMQYYYIDYKISHTISCRRIKRNDEIRAKEKKSNAVSCVRGR